MLDSGGLAADLLNAYNQETWESYAKKCASAIDSYVKSGTVKTDVTGIATSSSGSSYPVTGKGTGSATPTGFNLLESTFIDISTTSDDWEQFSKDYANAIGTFINSCVINTQVSGGCSGDGVGTMTCAAGLPSFTSSCETVFKYGTTYLGDETSAGVIVDFINALAALMASVVVTTSDAGTSPDPWVGAGVGGIS